MKIRTLISLSLAILIFGSNFGYALNIHYCGGEISKISFAFNPKKCGMENKKENEVPSKKELSKKSCCQDNTLVYQGQYPIKVQVKEWTNFLTPNSSLPPKPFGFQLQAFFVIENSQKWSPPPILSKQLFLHYQSLIFYD
tara:strand:+ start:734 stop:1153 length:420 start_codon:yes stop_codon:yes gene_type:complete